MGNMGNALSFDRRDDDSDVILGGAFMLDDTGKPEVSADEHIAGAHGRV